MLYTTYSHPKRNHHISLIFYAYNVSLPFLALFIDLYFNILISPRQLKIWGSVGAVLCFHCFN